MMCFWAPKISFPNEMSVAFFDLKGTGLPEEKSKEISDRFLTELYKTKGFKIITTKELWNLLQNEGVQKAAKFEDFDVNERSINSLEESNLVKFLAHTSMLLNIEAIIMGNLSMMDSNLYMSAKLIKANDGQVITIASKECNPSNKDSLNHALMIVANEIAEPMGALVYKEQINKNDVGKAHEIIKGFGRRNKEGIFKYDKSEGLWSFSLEGAVDSSSPVTVNFNKYKIECPNKENKKDLVIKCYDNNDLLEIVNVKDTSLEGKYLFDGQMSLFFQNGSTSFTGLFKNGYLNNAVWFDECGDTMASFISDMGKFKNMNIYNTDTTYAQSKISYGKIMYKKYAEETGENNNNPWKESYCRNNSGYESKCFCYAIVKRNDNDLIANNYQSFQDLLKHGLFISFYPNGVKKDSAFYVYGKLNGKWVQRHDDGKLQKVSNWKNGVEDGEQIEYWENGKIHTRCFVKNGVLNGDKKEYLKNGKLFTTEKFINGKSEDIVRLERYFQEGGDVNAVDTNGSTPLNRAIRLGEEEIVNLLLGKGANVNGEDTDGTTSLNTAITLHQEEIAKMLISKGANVNAKDNNGFTPLHCASFNRDTTIFKILISNGADVNSKSMDGTTPLHEASFYGRVEIVKVLISKGVDVNAKDNDGNTPLFEAINNGQLAIIKMLVSNGADLNVKDNIGDTPLSRAISQGNTEIVKTLVSNGADLNAKNPDGETALYHAIREMKNGKKAIAQEICNYLIDMGSNVNTKDYYGWTPLEWATMDSLTEIVKKLITKGADVNAKSYDGWTPVKDAIMYGNKDIFYILINKGADINISDTNGSTPLHLASSKGDKDIVNDLISMGADVNAKNNRGITPLHAAVNNDHAEIVNILISKGANVNAEDNKGQTPLSYAMHEKYWDIVEIFKKHGGK